MKYVIVTLTAVLVMLAGCATTKEAQIPAPLVELSSMTPLPPLNSIAATNGLKMNLLLHIMKDGRVENVKMLGSTGDAEWDSLALRSIRNWRYSPPMLDGVPAEVWFRQIVVVQVQEPVVLTLGELVCATRAAADSVYALLVKGSDLDTLFRQTMGTVDIMRYPPSVRDELKKLDQGEFTRPLRKGDQYVIYKRFQKSVI